MQVGSVAPGDLARVLEAILVLPKLSDPRIMAPAASLPVREDEAILRYAPVSQLLQSLASPTLVNSRVVSPNGAALQPVPAAVAELAKLDPAIVAAVAARIVHESGRAADLNLPANAAYGRYDDGTALAQAAIAAPVYAAAFTQVPDYTRKIDPKALAAIGDSAGRSRVPGWGSAAYHGARRLWARAPLLLLLLAWLAAGLCAGVATMVFASHAAAGSVFDLWALGFLAIAGLGFYARVRNVRFGAKSLE